MTLDRQKKLAMIGIDAGDLLFVQSHAQRLPNLRRLLEDGTVRRLETSSKWLTGSVWPSFYTGTSPGEHGIYHHLQWDHDAMRVRRVSAEWLYAEPFWYRLAREGLRISVLDVPMSFPSRLADGIEVTNWGSHDQLGRFHSNHPALTREIRKRFGVHPMGIEVPVGKTRGELQSIRDRLVTGARLKGELTRWLLGAGNWDLFLTVFGECHRGGHILWPEDNSGSAVPPDALLDVYVAVDAAIGAIIDDIPGVPLVLFALHGMQRYWSQEHLIPSAIERLNAVYRGAAVGDATLAAPPSGLMRRLRRSLPAGLQNAVAKAVPVGVRDWVESRATTGGLNWAETPGFSMLADLNGYVRLNLAGRESAGSIFAGSREHARYVDLLRTSLSELRADDPDDSGRALVAELVSIAEIYPGLRSSRLPDWVVTWQPRAPVERVRSRQLGKFGVRLNKGRSGNHRPEGFVSLLGRCRESAFPLCSITDLAPWVRGYFGFASR